MLDPRDTCVPKYKPDRLDSPHTHPMVCAGNAQQHLPPGPKRDTIWDALGY